MDLLLQAIRDELDSYASQHAKGHHFLFSIAAPAGPKTISLLKLPEVGKVIDLVNLMAYDYAGSWSNATGYNANLYHDPQDSSTTPFNTNDAVQGYINGEVTASKIVIRLPIYGRSFQQTEGIGKPFHGVGNGSLEEGVWDYKDIPKPGVTVTCDQAVLGCYSFDPNTKELIPYDTPEIISAKVNWLKSQGLRGSVFWEASGDKNGTESLIGASSKKALGSLDSTDNYLHYPDSTYDNIRSGMS